MTRSIFDPQPPRPALDRMSLEQCGLQWSAVVDWQDEVPPSESLFAKQVADAQTDARQAGSVVDQTRERE
jgi:hypothetical protein